MARKRYDAPKIITCAFSGKPIEYWGIGRPPRFHPTVAKEAKASARKAKSVALKQAA